MKNWKETRMKRLYTLKMLYKWCSMKKAIHCFFRTAPKINGLYTWNLSRKWQIKINKQDSRISTLKVLYTGCSTKKINIPISLVEHLEFLEWINFIHGILVGSDWWKSANRIQHSFHCLVTTYRVIHKRSNSATFIVESFQNEWVLSIEYG